MKSMLTENFGAWKRCTLEWLLKTCRKHVSTPKDQPYEKYDQDHAFLDNLNPENTFEVTKII